MSPADQAAGGKASNGYDFGGLFSRLEALIRAHGPRNTQSATASLIAEDEDATS